MEKHKRLTISFSKEFDAEYAYVKGLHNSSDFVCNAIRDRIQRDKGEDLEFEDRVRRVIQKVLQEEGWTKGTSEKIEYENNAADQDLLKAAEGFEL